MKVRLELQSETLAGVRAELEAFLAPDMAPSATSPTPSVTPSSPISSKASPPNAAPRKTEPTPSDIALGLVFETLSKAHTAPATASTRKGGSTLSASDIALGVETEDDNDADEVENEDSETEDDASDVVEDLADVDLIEEPAAPRTDAEALLADKASLQFNFERVLALQGRAAALGIVRGVLPRGTKTKLKDIESLPVELIGAAIEALQAAQAS